MKYFIFIFFSFLVVGAFTQTNNSIRIPDTSIIKPDTSILKKEKQTEDKYLKIEDYNTLQNKTENSLNRILAALALLLTGITIFLGLITIIAYLRYKRVMRRIKEKNAMIINDHKQSIKEVERNYNSLQVEHSLLLENFLNKQKEVQMMDFVDSCYEDNNFEKALKAISELKSEKFYPTSEDASYSCTFKEASILGEEIFKRNDFRKALKLFQELENKRPEDIDVYEMIGACCFKIATKGNPDNSNENKRFNKREEDEINENLNNAIKYFDKFIHHQDSNSEERKDRAELNMGICFLLLNKNQEALGIFSSYEKTGFWYEKDYYQSKLGLLCCYNEIDTAAYENELAVYFRQKDKFETGMEYCYNSFQYLYYYIERLEASFKKYLFSNNE